jgi:ketosteroid isomerase-like protein
LITGAGGSLEDLMEVVRSTFDPDIVVYEPESLPFGGVYKGRDAHLQMMQHAYTYFDTSQTRPERVVVDGENAVIMWKLRWLDPPADIQISEWFQVRDGKIVEIRAFYWDSAVLVH